MKLILVRTKNYGADNAIYKHFWYKFANRLYIGTIAKRPCKAGSKVNVNNAIKGGCLQGGGATSIQPDYDAGVHRKKKINV